MVQKKQFQRKPITKKLRFEVFKRDGFKCQYCGRSTPDVVLHIDHIDPVSNGGKNDILNLITSCESCNLGKSNTKLDDSSTVSLQVKQLQELNDRREQMKMVLKWRSELKQIEKEKNQHIFDYIDNKIYDYGFSISETFKQEISKSILKIGIAEAMDAIDQAGEKYLTEEKESVDEFLGKVDSYLGMKSLPENTRKIYYIRGILRNRLNYINERSLLVDIKQALNDGLDIDYIEQCAKTSRSWTDFMNSIR